MTNRSKNSHSYDDEEKSSSNFVTDKTFNSRQDLIDWVQNLGRSLGYVIIIKRSKCNSSGVMSKITFQCDRGGIYKPRKIYTRESDTKKINCPFGLIGKYFQEYNCWTLSVICEAHNHCAATYDEGHPYFERLKNHEFQLVQTLTEQNVKPRHILSTLKKQNPDNVSTPQTIYNARAKIRLSTKEGRSPMELLFSFLHQKNYIYFTRVDKETDELEDLFFAHPISVDIWRAFPHSVCIYV